MLLLLTDDRAFGIRTAKRLMSRGILVLWAKLEVGRRLCDYRDVGGAIVDGRARLQTAQVMVEDMLDRYPEMPVALISLPRTVVDSRATSILRETDDDALTEVLFRFSTEICGCKTKLCTYSLTVGDDSTAVIYLGYEIHLPPRALWILRLLFFRAPYTVDESELLSVCFPEGTQRASNLAVQISAINRRAEAVVGLPLVESVYGKGYRLCGGIVRYPKKAK